MKGGPIKRREHAGQGTREARNIIGDDREPIGAEAQGIAIGVEDEAFALRRQALDHMVEDRAARDEAQGLVATAHAASQPPRQYDAERRRLLNHPAPPSCAGPWIRP